MNKILNFLRSQNPRLLLATITVIAIGIIALLGFGLQRYLAGKDNAEQNRKTAQEDKKEKPKPPTPSVPSPNTPKPDTSAPANIPPSTGTSKTSPKQTVLQTSKNNIRVIKKRTIVNPQTTVIRIKPISTSVTANETSASASAIAPGACAFAHAGPNGAFASTTCP